METWENIGKIGGYGRIEEMYCTGNYGRVESLGLKQQPLLFYYTSLDKTIAYNVTFVKKGQWV